MTETRTEILPDTGASDTPAVSTEAPAGTRVGKYVIRCTIGAGGCGTVYAAYDPLLEREVALKLLARTPPSEGATADAGWSTLVREARMLARLSEPEVVTVYDVGEDDGQAFLAMQMVKGGDLKQWIARHRGPEAQQRRPLSAVLQLLEQAGRGLAIAHEAGVVHGDFKPANVLIDSLGRPKVSDFGIARLAEAHAAPAHESEHTQPAAQLLETGNPREPDVSVRTLTTTKGRIIVGTPAYMAPEQFDGQAADVASDVYAFCATAYHAIYGALPFVGKTVHELAAKKTEHTLVLPTAPLVPGWLSKLITRGMAAEPGRRHPNMAAVLAEFERARAGPRRGWFLVAGVVGGAGVVAGAMTWGASSMQPGCEQTGADFPWTPSVRSEIALGFAARGDAAAGPVIERIEARMDAFSEEWEETRKLACSAAWVDPAVGDQAFACLRRRRSVVGAMVDVWSGATPHAATTALAAVSALPSVTACIDPEALGGQPDFPENAALRERVIAARERIDASTARARAGAIDEAMEEARAVYEEATSLGYEPLIAQSALAHGQALAIAGEFSVARQRYRAAFFAAQRWDDHETAGRAADALVFLVGTRLEEHEQGLLWADHARVSLGKSGGSTAALSSNEASILDRMGRHDEAVVRYTESLQAHSADDPFGHGVTHMRLGDALRALGRASEALQHYDQAIDKWGEALGPTHPRIAVLVQSRATALDKLGRTDEAITAFQRAITGLTALFGPDHINVGVATVNLGISLKHAGRLEEAEVAMRESLRITIATYGEQHLKVAHRRDALGRLLLRAEKNEAAIEQHERAREIYDRELPKDHPDRVVVRVNLGDAAQAAGRHDDAIARFEAAVQIAGLREPDSELEGDALAYLGRGLTRAGRSSDAQVALRRAVTLLSGTTRYADSKAMAIQLLAGTVD